MKKIFIIVLIMCSLVITGCNSKKEEILKPNNNGDIIVYSESPNFGTREDEYDYYYITLNSDRELTWGKAVSGVSGRKNLSVSQYQAIINFAFAEKFKNIGEDISDKSVMDGTNSSITLYYSDKSTFVTGGVNPKNKLYNQLVNKLKEYTK